MAHLRRQLVEELVLLEEAEAHQHPADPIPVALGVGLLSHLLTEIAARAPRRRVVARDAAT